MSEATPRTRAGHGISGSQPPEAAAGERQVPFFCPYCGEEELRPGGLTPGDWECRACARAFRLRFAGVVRSGAGTVS